MERKKFILPTALILGLLVVNEVGVANAAYVFDNNAAVTEIAGGLSGGGAGFGETFQTQVSNLSKGLLASAKIIAVIMTAAAGCMVCFGIHDGKKTFWNWILGIGLAINFGDLILNLWSVESVSAPTKIEDYKLLMKSEDDPSVDILSPFIRYYIGVIMSGAAVIAPYAVNLTLLLAMIDGVIKVAFDLISGDKIKFFVTMILKIGFFIFLIQSWVGTNSSYQLMPALSSGFETMGYTAGGAEDMVKEYDRANPDSNIEVQSNQIVTNALNFFNIFWEHAQQQNLLTIFIGLVCVVAAVVILFLTALGRDSVYGADRILDNGVDNDTAFAVRSDWTAKIFVGESNRHDVQLSDKNFCGGVYLHAFGKYFDGTGRQCERNGDLELFHWQHKLFLTSIVVRADSVLHDEENSGAGVGTFIWQSVIKRREHERNGD